MPTSTQQLSQALRKICIALLLFLALWMPIQTAWTNAYTDNRTPYQYVNGVKVIVVPYRVTPDDIEPLSGDFAWRYFQWGIVDGAKTTGFRYTLGQLFGDDDLGDYVNRLLNITNPTPFMLTLGFLVMAWIVHVITRPKRGSSPPSIL
jgi:hypothetical protein